jgi:hypothetical protein
MAFGKGAKKKTDGQNIHDYLENMEYDPIDNIR